MTKKYPGIPTDIYRTNLVEVAILTGPYIPGYVTALYIFGVKYPGIRGYIREYRKLVEYKFQSSILSMYFSYSNLSHDKKLLLQSI